MDIPTQKKRTVASQAAPRRPQPELRRELLDRLVKVPMMPAVVHDLMLAFKGSHGTRNGRGDGA